MSHPPPVYNHIYDVENLDLYAPGGYHPIELGHQLDGRYRVLQKLGHGGYSTVWLARDEAASSLVAVKVGRADSSGSIQKEADILASLSQRDDSPSPIPPVLDRFSVRGPNGLHTCFTTTPARCSVRDAKEGDGSGLFTLDVARSLAAQLIMAVAHVHGLGFVHGDIHLGNALLRLPSDFQTLSGEDIRIKYDAPEPEPITRADGKPLAVGVPSHATPAIWLGADSEGIAFSEAKLLLSDFGTAFSPQKEARFNSFTPWMIQPPEARFEPSKPLSFPSDIWGLGFAVWAIFGQRPLHDSFLLSRDDALADQVDALGSLPPEWWKRWEARSKRFTDDGRPKDGRSVWTWDARFEDSIQEPRRREGMELVQDEEKAALYELVRGMLHYRPEDRWSIEKVMGSSWMQNWGLPTMKGL